MWGVTYTYPVAVSIVEIVLLYLQEWQNLPYYGTFSEIWKYYCTATRSKSSLNVQT